MHTGEIRLKKIKVVFLPLDKNYSAACLKVNFTHFQSVAKICVVRENMHHRELSIF